MVTGSVMAALHWRLRGPEYKVPHTLRCLQGLQGFRGLQLVARELTTARLPELAGKRVVVLGCGKSSVDACAAAAEVAGSTTMLFRKAGQPVCCGLVCRVWGQLGTVMRSERFALRWRAPRTFISARQVSLCAVRIMAGRCHGL